MKLKSAITSIRRRTIQIATLVGVFISFTLAGDAFSQLKGDAAGDTFAEMLKTEATDLPPASVQEILEIRQRLGGGTGLGASGLGISKLFDQVPVAKVPISAAKHSSILDDNPAENDSRTASAIDTLLSFECPSPDLASCKSERMFFEMLAENTQKDATNRDQEAVQPVAALRNVVRRMDSLAADLEEMELYSDADSIRNRASKLRAQARRSAKSMRDPGDLKVR